MKRRAMLTEGLLGGLTAITLATALAPVKAQVPDGFESLRE